MFLQNQYENQNKGLPTRFQLTEGGAFMLIGGRKKVDDNVKMFLNFTNWFRIFTQDYCLGYYANRFVQNTSSYLFQFKNILRLKILEVGKKYIPFANFYAVDIPLDPTNRKETTIFIQFQYKLKNVDDYQIIKKVII